MWGYHGGEDEEDEEDEEGEEGERGCGLSIARSAETKWFTQGTKARIENHLHTPLSTPIGINWKLFSAPEGSRSD